MMDRLTGAMMSHKSTTENFIGVVSLEVDFEKKSTICVGFHPAYQIKDELGAIFSPANMTRLDCMYEIQNLMMRVMWTT